MLSFLPTGTNLILKSSEGPVLDGITMTRYDSVWGMSFSVLPTERRPERQDITEKHLLGYYNKYVARWHGGKGFWDSLHSLLSVKDGPYAGLTLNEVKIAGPERDQSQAFPLDWGIPQGASFHVKYPGDAPESEPCNFFAGGDGAGFMPAGSVPALLSAEKLVANYCERFGLPKGRDPYSVIIWRTDAQWAGVSLRASKARMDADLEARQRAALHRAPKQKKPEEKEELWMKLCRENCDRDARYNAAWARAQASVELERKALAEELARKEAAAVAAAEDAAREAAADAIFAEEERAALAEKAASAAASPNLSVASALALFQAKAAALVRQVEELELLKVVQAHVKALESRIAELKTELNIE
jgi:hypothetical protein